MINFGEMTEAEARRWPDLMAIVEAKVQPERADGQARLLTGERWWHYGEQAPGALRRDPRPRSRAGATRDVSKYLAFAFLASCELVYAHSCRVLRIDE